MKLDGEAEPEIQLPERLSPFPTPALSHSVAPTYTFYDTRFLRLTHQVHQASHFSLSPHVMVIASLFRGMVHCD